MTFLAFLRSESQAEDMTYLSFFNTFLLLFKFYRLNQFSIRSQCIHVKVFKKN